MEILSQSTLTLAQNSLKKELKQIEQTLSNRKETMKSFKTQFYGSIPVEAIHAVNKSFSKEFSKLEKKKAKIVSALTELKKIHHCYISTEQIKEKSSNRFITKFEDMEVSTVYKIINHSDEHIFKNAWVGCEIARVDDKHFHFLTQSLMDCPDERALNVDTDSSLIEKCSVKMKFVRKMKPKTYTLEEIEREEFIGKKFEIINANKSAWIGAIIEIYKHDYKVVRNKCIKQSDERYPAIGSGFCVENECDFIEVQS